MGKITFLDLVNRSCFIQVIAEKVDADPWRHRSVLRGYCGLVAPRRAFPGRWPTLELLAKIRAPLPDTFHGLTDTEARYRKRYLDLLMNEDARGLPLCAAASCPRPGATSMREGFVEVETPVLQPRYGGAFAEPFRRTGTTSDQDFPVSASRPSCI